MRLARVIAALAALLLVIVLLNVVSEGFESPWPYAAVTAIWLGGYFVLDRVTGRIIKATPRRSRRNLWRLGACAVAMAALGLSMLSAVLMARYALAPAKWRQIRRELHADRFDPISNRFSGYGYAYLKPKPEAQRVVFIHGTPGNASSMAHYALEPIDGLECVAVDRPGFGRASSVGPIASFEDQAGILAGLLVDRPTGKTIIVGHSLGGPIAARIAADYPERVGGLIILAGSLDPELEGVRWYNDATSVEPIQSKMFSNYQNANFELQAALEQTRLLAKVLHRVTCPVRIIHGTADDLVPAGNTQYAQRMLTSSASVEVIMVPDEGHGVHKTCAELVRACVLELARGEFIPKPPAPSTPGQP